MRRRQASTSTCASQGMPCSAHHRNRKGTLKHTHTNIHGCRKRNQEIKLSLRRAHKDQSRAGIGVRTGWDERLRRDAMRVALGSHPLGIVSRLSVCCVNRLRPGLHNEPLSHIRVPHRHTDSALHRATVAHRVAPAHCNSM